MPDQLADTRAGRSRWQQIGPWVIGAVAVAALLIGLQFVPAEAGPSPSSEAPAGTTR